MKATTTLLALAFALLVMAVPAAPADDAPPTPESLLAALKDFFAKCAKPDGSFQPGIDPKYEGMSDSAYSDLAPTAYAVVIHKTFGWKLPDEEKTRTFLLTRQKPLIRSPPPGVLTTPRWD